MIFGNAKWSNLAYSYADIPSYTIVIYIAWALTFRNCLYTLHLRHTNWLYFVVDKKKKQICRMVHGPWTDLTSTISPFDYTLHNVSIEIGKFLRQNAGCIHCRNTPVKHKLFWWTWWEVTRYIYIYVWSTLVGFPGRCHNVTVDNWLQHYQQIILFDILRVCMWLRSHQLPFNIASTHCLSYEIRSTLRAFHSIVPSVLLYKRRLPHFYLLIFLLFFFYYSKAWLHIKTIESTFIIDI